MSRACCGSVTTKIGTATANSINRCMPRNFAEDIPTLSYTTGTTTTTVTYSCLNTTRPAAYTALTRCTNETNCGRGYCCATLNYTIASNARNLSFNECVPGD